MTYLVDTNIISELCRREPDPGVLVWAGTVTRYAVSVISLDEVFFGLAWRPNARVLAWMEGYFQRHQVLTISPAIARHAGELRGQLATRGLVRHQADMLIAATAQAHQLTLVTRNTRDFEHCGIGLLNPFSDA
ncbi:type II toxin-antitoxin system VapC family toxin [uncultured Thiodictyon sp.]|uniref:type II toxin-antitoxin system VapC family toxin n=1 Tax=uncultured Thiodictyon sp. TaxID=1846217 RepID=UPI0025EFE358|nr:type II toxin-antitoxin system VapC family toxin [uncultured Thiodictyon sp.]